MQKKQKKFVRKSKKRRPNSNYETEKIDINRKKDKNFVKKSKKNLWLTGTAEYLLTQPL